MSKLPPNWSWVKLGDVGDVVAGGTPSTKIPEYFDGKIAWITPADLTGYKHKYISRGRKNISKEGLKNSSARIIPKGSILFSSRAPIGYVAIASNELCTNQGFKNLIPNQKVNSEFVYYYLKSAKQLAEKNASGTTFKEISSTNFKQLSIPLPPLPEQKKIVEKIEELFSGLDSGVGSLKKAKEQIRLYRQSVLSAAFSGRLTQEARGEKQAYLNGVQGFAGKESEHLNAIQEVNEQENSEHLPYKQMLPDQTNTEHLTHNQRITKAAEPKVEYGNQLPDGWKWVKLGEVSIKIQYGYTESASPKPIGPKFLRITDIQNGNVIWNEVPYCKISDELKVKYKLKDGDIVFARTGATVGKSFLISGKIPDSVFASYLIRIRLSENINKKFIYFFFQSNYYWQQITEGQVGIGQPNVNGTKLSQLIVPFCSIEEQTQIVEEIEKRFSEADNLEKAIDESLAKSETLRQAILKQAFEGRLVK